MKRRLFALCIAGMMVFALFPSIAFAADHPLVDGESIDISACAQGDTVTVAAGAHVTISGSNTNIQIVCGAGVGVTLSGVTIDNSAYEHVCPLLFTGSGNTLTLAEGTENTLTAGIFEAGVCAGEGTELTIEGAGTLNATGGFGGAGIGGGHYTVSGTITISSSGTLNATGMIGSGIGGGMGKACGTIRITSGTVNAVGDSGIGAGGFSSAGNYGTVIIEGGNVTAKGGAGIGGAANGASVSILICGGNVTATGSGGAGISSSPDPLVPAFFFPIIISGDATVIASGGNGGAGIGGYKYNGSGYVTISENATVTATGSVSIPVNGVSGGGAGIGGGFGNSSGQVVISDNATVTATGGDGAAGIGGGQRYLTGGYTVSCQSGYVDISGGTITATGGIGGAGIGSGYDRISGSDISTYVSIKGDADVTAYGGDYAAGIGCGDASVNGISTTISEGATVVATGGDGAAGIGGGRGGNGGIIDLLGGTVTATGGTGGAGVGGGAAVNTGTEASPVYQGGGAGSIAITAGRLYVASGADAHDIGKGMNGATGGVCSISGTAVVFVKNDACMSTITYPEHQHLAFGAGTTAVSRYAIPETWTSAFGAYLKVLYTLNFDSQGGSSVPSAYLLYSDDAVNEPDDPTWDSHIFGGWYETAACDTMPVIFPYTITADTTLYAKWTELTLESTDADGKIYVGGRVTLTPNIEDGEWDWDGEYFSATFNSPATFTALKAGTSTITYTVEGESTTYDVTIEESGLPSTGQDMTWVWLLIGAALILGAAGAAVLKRKAAK